MIKAINDGHCQWCGRRQRLPGGVLAKHGYHLRWGWMAGECRGSGHLPIEQSKSLIDESIAWAERRSQELMHQANEAILEAQGDGNKAWVRVYHRELSSRSRGSVWLWEQREIFRNGGFGGWYLDGDGKQHVIHKRFESIRPEGASSYAAHLRRDAGELISYRDEQMSRAAAWEQKPPLPRAS